MSAILNIRNTEHPHISGRLGRIGIMLVAVIGVLVLTACSHQPQHPAITITQLPPAQAPKPPPRTRTQDVLETVIVTASKGGGSKNWVGIGKWLNGWFGSQPPAGAATPTPSAPSYAPLALNIIAGAPAFVQPNNTET